MRIFLLLLISLSTTEIVARECSSLLDFDMKSLGENNHVNLCQAYQGKVILVVNTASRCAYTDQYDALEKLYSRYRDDGLVVLGFPSNDFGNQEPGSEKQIKHFCRMTYGVRFPMFSKTHVTQNNAHPFYEGLAQASGTYPRWNFHKYLIDANGQLVGSYRSSMEPFDDVIISDIENQIKRF